MSIRAVLLPLFVQVALTLFLLFWMGFSRVGALRRGETKMSAVALGEPNWPARVQQISNCFANQFQLPVLFYVLTVLAIVTHLADVLFVAMAWAFVATRLAHAYIHTSSNNVPRRFYVFLAGGIILVVMWIVFAGRILLAGMP
jgi:hypothetical protein